MTAKPRVRILVVDDMESVVKEISACFDKFGYELEIDYHCPLDRDQPFGGCQLPTESALDDFDFAFIDLEIFPSLLEPFHYSPEDLRGGTEVLPYLRKNAPWLPVLAYSRLFTEQSRDWFLEVATGFGFDGHASRKRFSDKSLTSQNLHELLSRLTLQRKQHTLGYGFSGAERVQVDVSNELRIKLDKEIVDCRKLFAELFFFARKVVVEPVRSGWSGASVFRAFVKQDVLEIPREGEWLVKMSSSPWKLNQEAISHIQMMRSGFDFARYTPLLYRNVVGARNRGAIVYQFANGTVDGIEFLTHSSDVVKLAETTSMLLSSFYGGLQSDRGLISTILKPWLPNKEDMQKSASALGTGRIFKLLNDLIAENAPSSFQKSISFRTALLHGDLHCGNIMIGEKNLLIDFAHSKTGPILVDLAKFISDVAIRFKEFQTDEFPNWGTNSHPIRKVIKPLREKFELNSDEEKLFDMVLGLLLAQSLNYDSVSADAKEWVRRILKT